MIFILHCSVGSQQATDSIQDHAQDTDVGENALIRPHPTPLIGIGRARVSNTRHVFALKMVRRCCRARKQTAKK
jgi:hypothetical protein